MDLRFSFCCSYGYKITGSRMVASKEYQGFAYFTVAMLLLSLAYGLVAMAAILPHREDIAYHYGTTACFYASSSGCAPLYEDIFRGGGGHDGSLRSGFTSLAVVVVLQCVFLMVKAGLYCCLDFDFMAATAAASFVLVFTPAILIAKFAFHSDPGAIFIAMYAPHMLIIPVFAARLLRNTRAMTRGVGGPWADHQKHFDMKTKAATERASSLRSSSTGSTE